MLATLLISILFFSQVYLNQTIDMPGIKISNQDRKINLNQNFLLILNGGQKRLMSSLLWIKTLLEADLEHYKNRDTNSWMALRFQTIIALDPKFYLAYLYGGQHLSIINDDDYGAELIYRKGLEKFPNDFWLNYNGAFHYYFELNNLDKAIEHYSRIVNHPLRMKVMPNLPSLLAKLQMRNNSLEAAHELIKGAYLNETDEKLKEHFLKTLKKIEEKIQKK